MRANPSSLRLQSSQAPASFRPHPALLASADCLRAPSTLRPKKIPVPPLPLPPKHVASVRSLRPLAHKNLTTLSDAPAPNPFRSTVPLLLQLQLRHILGFTEPDSASTLSSRTP